MVNIEVDNGLIDQESLAGDGSIVIEPMPEPEQMAKIHEAFAALEIMQKRYDDFVSLGASLAAQDRI